MKREELFEAIGGAEDRYLLQSEKTRARRFLTRAAAVAACVALLCGTAMAITPIRNAILGISVSDPVGAQHKELTDLQGQTIWADYPGYQEVTLTLSRGGNAPEGIETYYLPQGALSWTKGGMERIRQDENGITLTDPKQEGRTIAASITLDKDEERFVLFRQLVIPENGIVQEFLPLDQADHAEMDSFERKGQNVLRFTFGNAAVLYWSDGEYLFCLTAWNMAQNEAMALIDLQAVEAADYLAEETVPTVRELDRIVRPTAIPEGFDEQPADTDGAYPAVSRWVRDYDMILLYQWAGDEQITHENESDRWISVGGQRVLVYDLTEDETGRSCGLVALWNDGEYLFELEYRSAAVTEKAVAELIESMK